MAFDNERQLASPGERKLLVDTGFDYQDAADANIERDNAGRLLHALRLQGLSSD